MTFAYNIFIIMYTLSTSQNYVSLKLNQLDGSIYCQDAQFHKESKISNKKSKEVKVAGPEAKSTLFRDKITALATRLF